MDLGKILDNVAKDLSLVEQAILENVKTDIPLLTEISEYILGSGGKRLRPALVLLSAKLFNDNSPQTIQAAQVVEYLHTATLLHDDVVDNADMRRSQEAVHRRWGKDASVLVGDYLFSMVFQQLTELKNLEVLEIMSHTTTLMAKGEIQQLARPYHSITEAEYLEIIVNKTACLFASALKIGAVLAVASNSAKQALYDYGMAIGLAFQIIDDALDYMNQHSQTGKPIGIDLKERKITLPLIHLLNTAVSSDKVAIETILSKKTITDEHVQQVIEMMEHYGATQYSIEVAQKYANTAKNCLVALPKSPTQQMLNDIAHFIVIRRF